MFNDIDIDILNYIDELQIRILDSNNNIIYPKEKEKLEEFNKIISHYNSNEIINYNGKKWYKYQYKKINNEKESYILQYLLDITKYKIAEEKYKTDSLTSVLTRPIILEKIHKELIDCYKKNIPFAIIIGDIDHFKDINDTYGHLIGDAVLRELGNILLNQTQENSKFVGRYGGEEFLLFFKNVTLHETIETISKIKHTLDKLIIKDHEKEISNITMSFGIYYIKNLKEENIIKNTIDKITENLINRADIALYKSKEEGRNQTHLFTNNGIIEKIEYK